MADESLEVFESLVLILSGWLETQILRFCTERLVRVPVWLRVLLRKMVPLMALCEGGSSYSHAIYHVVV